MRAVYEGTAIIAELAAMASRVPVSSQQAGRKHTAAPAVSMAFRVTQLGEALNRNRSILNRALINVSG